MTNITDETPFTGIIEMSALVDKAEFGGNALVYLPKYVQPDDELFEKTDAEIEETFLSALEKMYPHFNRKDVAEFKVSRVRRVFPLPTLRYSDDAPGVRTSLENIFVVNSSQITNGTLNVNETIQLASRVVHMERILLLQKMGRAGIHVLDWDVTESFDLLVRKTFSRTPVWLRTIGR